MPEKVVKMGVCLRRLSCETLAQVKFFTPDAQWTWYVSEFDGEDLFFGLVIGLDIELGWLPVESGVR